MKKACMKLETQVVWTLTYIINADNTVSILNFDKEDNDGYMFFNQLDTLDFIKESDGRIAESVSINGTEYPVANKQGVFTYKQPL